MTKRDFFRILIKISGLYFLVAILVSPILSYLPLLMAEGTLFQILTFTIASILVAALFVFLVFKPDSIIKILKLDKGFDDDRIDVQNVKINTILTLAIAVIGGILLIDNIPSFISNAFFAFKSKVAYNEFEGPGHEMSIKICINLVNIIIGYLMISNREYVYRVITNKKEVKEEKEP